jgi:hypothetical protein
MDAALKWAVANPDWFGYGVFVAVVLSFWLTGIVGGKR